jgi:nicotinamidase/pyrazinamidase
MSPLEPIFRKGDGLLVLDVQIDFCPGGALPIAQGDRVVPILNEWIQAAGAKHIPVYASRDYHPKRHLSFKEQGGPWPPHCIQDSAGARFHPALRLPDSTVIITKGVRFDQDQYSVFDQTGLAVLLRSDGIERLIVGGLALDVCVLATVLDAIEAGFSVTVIEGGTRPITPEGGKEALAKMKAAGAEIL